MVLFKKINFLDDSFPEHEIEELSKKDEDHIKAEIEKFFNDNGKESSHTIKRRWNSIRDMIFSLDERIRYWENRRTQFLQLATALLAAAILSIVTILPRYPNINILNKFEYFIYTPVAIASLVLLFGSLRLLKIWNNQNNPNYPFSKGYRVWRWHYRHAEKAPLETKVESYTIDSFKKEAIKFHDNLTTYKLKTIQSEATELFNQDLTQLYLLIINEKFKIKFVNTLRNSLVKTLNFSWIFGILSLFVMVWLKLVIYGYLFYE